jgi:hypothetical protein
VFPHMEGVAVPKKQKKPKYGMVDDKCWVSCYRVKGAFPNMESMTVQK